MPCQVPRCSRLSGDGDAELRLGQRALDVGRHVVGPFVVVAVKRDIFRHEAAQKSIEVVPNIGRRILLDQQRRRRVRDVEGEEPDRDPLALGPLRDVGGDLPDLARRGVDREAGLGDMHCR
jgi:hypothetical protein